MKVIVLIGISNSGKSTYVKENYPAGKVYNVYSADKWFTKDGGSYIDNFAPSELPKAHGWCQREFTEAVQATSPIVHGEPSDGFIIVDNTNTTVMEMATYCTLALAYGHELELVVIHCDPEVAISRDNGHGTPEGAIRAQYERLTKTLAKNERGYFAELPPWWPVTEVNNV